MSLLIPDLDDRRFNDLMKEALSLIPIYHKEWTNYNPSDPGITLLELFAWFSEMVIYRVNRVPESHHRNFLRLIGVHFRTDGTGTISSEAKTVYGEGTAFTNELNTGDPITAGGQRRIITAINSDTELMVDSAFVQDLHPGTSFTCHWSAGTGTISNKGTIVTGDGTFFMKELKTGDLLLASGQTRSVMNIISDTQLIVDSDLEPELPAQTEFSYSFISLESGIQRGLESINQRYRAITATDYESLARECMDTLQEDLTGREICVNNRNLEYGDPYEVKPGHVSIIIIPGCAGDTDYCKNGVPTSMLKKTVWEYLDARRLITTRVHVTKPEYQNVALFVKLVLIENANEMSVKKNIVERIRTYFDAIEGGPDGEGWPLGRNLYRSEIYHLVEGITGVDHIIGIKINGSDTNVVKVGEFQLISITSAVEVQYEQEYNGK